MPLLSEIADCFEALAPLALQEPYDNSGLQIGNPALQVESALVALDLNEQVVDEALALGANLIISHHPLIFKGLKRLTQATMVERIVHRCILHNIALYACHTNLDAASGGVSYRLAQKLGIENGAILEPRSGLLTDEVVKALRDSHPYEEQAFNLFQMQNKTRDTGFGWVGLLPESCSPEEFLLQVKKILGTGALRYSTLPARAIHKVAVCGGSGAELLSAALAAGADAYITADVKYHTFQEAEGRLLLIDAGHYETEQFTKELFYDVLTKKFNNFAVHISKVKTNPINYL